MVDGGGATDGTETVVDLRRSLVSHGWRELKQKAKEKGMRILGVVEIMGCVLPCYVAEIVRVLESIWVSGFEMTPIRGLAFVQIRARSGHCMRLSVHVSRSWSPVSVYRGPETQVLRAKCRGPESQVLRAKCSNRALTKERESRLLIGLEWLLKLGFLGRYQYIKNLLKKRRRRY
jgi:hypothetical protein